MGEVGRTCRPVDRRGKLEAEPVTVKATRDTVRVEFRGRLLVARKTGNFKRGNERR